VIVKDSLQCDGVWGKEVGDTGFNKKKEEKENSVGGFMS
jgi:hypothetical protein